MQLIPSFRDSCFRPWTRARATVSLRMELQVVDKLLTLVLLKRRQSAKCTLASELYTMGSNLNNLLAY